MSQNLVFTFNKDVVNTADLNTWEATKFIAFSPGIEGRFKWISKNEVLFSPKKELLPATKYTAKLSPKILQKSIDKKLSIDDEEISFHSPYLKIVKKEVFWAKSKNSTKPNLALKLTFNYPINSGELAKSLKLSEKGKNVSFSLGMNQSENESIFKINTAQNLDSDNLTLTLEKGLKVPNSIYQTENKIEEEVLVPEAKNLEIVSLEKGFEHNEGFIKVITNQQLKDQKLEELIR